MSRHVCHAHGCNTAVPAKLFMCKKHWSRVPANVQAAIWREHVPGQELRKDPSARYMAVQQLAIARVAFRPNDEAAARISAQYLSRALHFQQVSVLAGNGDPLATLLRRGER